MPGAGFLNTVVGVEERVLSCAMSSSVSKTCKLHDLNHHGSMASLQERFSENRLTVPNGYNVRNDFRP